jgi:hypothetical protein
MVLCEKPGNSITAPPRQRSEFATPKRKWTGQSEVLPNYGVVCGKCFLANASAGAKSDLILD